MTVQLEKTKQWPLGKLPGEGLLSFEMNLAAQLSFEKFYLNKPQDFWNYAPWTDQTKVKIFCPNL